MAFKNVEDRDLAKEMIAKGQKPKEIVAALGDRCGVADVYALRAGLKKNTEEAATSRRSGERGTGATPAPPLTAQDEEFAVILLENSRRLKRLWEETEQLYRTLTNGK